MGFTSLHFLLAYALVLIVPGPNTLAVAGQAALMGTRPVVPLALGIALGATLLLGISHAAATTLALAGCCQRILAAAALLYIAWRIARAGRAELQPSRARMQFTAGVVTAVCNPVTMAFFVAQLIALNTQPLSPYHTAIVVGGVPLLAFCNAMLAAVLFSRPRIRRAVAAHRGIFANAAGLILAGLAIRVAIG
ncbi:leucine export protein LeuE [Variibacter gotjawalensis]|uniref:Leucine export protein LeuE n=1 Tax=Variibacter gotjawalensis TaxID=1333996 RepID=A0A0S3PR66_9BRAD|nr:LysE family transporter [Variibacter gotjawalensis]NIK48736.1 threonine/homoserine/homoserine lactone efflux protein [Variibacter gotjawalensis]RZS50597.1 threonine/homoserine/homoserine lactone efflux protein [Variibacter gotjawalensis]BAT58431.1 leucine export protein LeuE [Variibacter gotjawalensis]